MIVLHVLRVRVRVRDLGVHSTCELQVHSSTCMHFSWPGFCMSVMSRALPQCFISELSPVLSHDCPAWKGNESCSSFQGHGVGMMCFLPCVCWVWVQASADVPVCVYVSQYSNICEGWFEIFTHWEHFDQSSGPNLMRGGYVDLDETRLFY